MTARLLWPRFQSAPPWRAGDARLAPWPDALRAAEWLECWSAPDAQQAATRARMVAFVRAHPGDAHRRELAIGHLTASALVVDSARGAALLTLHKKLERWLQLGGHADGDANLPAVALREAGEESGLAELAIFPDPIDVDVHRIPARAGEPEHWHFDTRFLVLAEARATARASAESHRLEWFTPSQVRHLETDESVRRLFGAVFAADDRPPPA